MPAQVAPALDPAPSSTTGLLREVGVVAGAMLVYFAVRNVTVGSADAAHANAERLIAFERQLGLDWEGSLQRTIVDHGWLVTLANWVYIWGHWPVILSVAFALYVLQRSRYLLLRNAMFVSGLVGFAFFALVPVAPPRLLDLGLVDTVTEQSEAYRTLQPPGLTNQYAALPSLHAGWNLLVAIVLLLTFAHAAVRVMAVLLPIAMSLAVVVTANHYVVDVAAGAALVLVGLAVSLTLERRRVAATLEPSGVAGRRRHVRRPPHRVAVRGGTPRGQLHH